ncbi:secretin N-terminal domain-containing protein [Flocculibacter collagenilyticus]|uniref:secretin N-terminal domain-containing protein n=1 Tax=Flocculibacter collagenilyticus TaxID=2744479 RepID=UPI0018F54E29|nr:secretin N-terminal domain-containing protein [Flocculibacter collagenilyticus]
MKSNSTVNPTIFLFISFFLAGCVSSQGVKTEPVNSFLSEKINTNDASVNSQNDKSIDDQSRNTGGLSYVHSIKHESEFIKKPLDVEEKLSDNEMLTISADQLFLKDFIHYVLGEELSLSYIIGNDVKNDTDRISLNLQSEISKRKLFSLSEEVLSERGYVIRYDDGVYYIHKRAGGMASHNIVYGYGGEIEDVPNTATEIIQMVPFKYGQTSLLNLMLKQIVNVQLFIDHERNAALLRGKRAEILRALEFIQLIDRPRFRERKVAIYKSTFISTQELLQKLKELLVQDGVSVNNANLTTSAVSLVPLERIGALVVFSNSKDLIERVGYWAEEIDKPLVTTEKQYFVYTPRYSRATDLGQSLQLLIGGASNLSRSNEGNKVSANSQNKAVKSSMNTSNSSVSHGQGRDVNFVVDERANTIIIESTGEKYQQLLPLITRLDVLPKQVMLEVLIAEVTLTDEFKQGVEFALSNGSYNLSTSGAFGSKSFGGLSYLVSGVNGSLSLNLFETNSNVNIISKPSIVVRDGVQAQIRVGTDIPIVGQTVQDPLSGEKQVTSIEYRSTGVELSVTPVVNAQGVVIMEIQQSISNEADGGSTVANSPSIFERSISTEVVAESGQTVILGGLISENKSNKQTAVPGISDLPIIGSLFGATSNTGTKTELIVLVTPKIIESAEEWVEIKEKLHQGLDQLQIF